MRPLRFVPLLKRLRWGGTRLGSVLGKPLGEECDYAESWEICDHGSDQSIVTDGSLKGWTLQRLVRERPCELLGKHAHLTQFPLLMKFLDARDRLSVQVHPNDEQARAHRPFENGKTEAWVIVDAAPGSDIFAGFMPGVDRAALERELAGGTVENCLNRIQVSAGDCIFIPAGTVHAIGEGVLLAEVQQASDVTFRLFDWGRAGADGKPRELHLEQAMSCTDFDRGPVGKSAPTIVHEGGHSAEELVRCPHFVIRRHNTESPFTLVDDGRCHILTVLRGNLALDCGKEISPLRIGDTTLIPAAALSVRVIPEGDVSVLETYLP